MKKIGYVVRPYIHQSGRIMVRVRWNNKKYETSFSAECSADPDKWNKDASRAKINTTHVVKGVTYSAKDMIRGRIHLNIYIQYENTDTNTSEAFDEFFNRWNTYRGEIRRLDRRGNGRSYYFNYDLSDKASVMKSILLEYAHKKYADKLKDEP